MSTIDRIATDPAAIAGAAQPDGFSQLTSEEFTKIIFTELSNQDPLEPNDTAALLEQLSMLRSIQSDIDMMDRLSSIVDQNELAGASSLIGKLVSGINESNERVLDFVLSVSRTKDGAVLNLERGGRVAMGNVDEIIDPIALVPPEEGQP